MTKKKTTAKKLGPEQRECIRLLKAARRNDWTLEAIAAHLGTSFSTISRWVAERNRPSRNTAKRMIPLLEKLAA